MRWAIRAGTRPKSPNGPKHAKARADERGMITKTRKRKQTTKRRTSTKARRFKGIENRASDRVKLVAAATLYTELTPHPEEGHRVWMTNISLGGLAFKTRRQYEVGDHYHIRLDAGPLDMSAPIRLVWIQKKEDGIFEVGAEFVPD